MRFVQVNVSLPKLHIREAEVGGQQGVLHAIVLADVKDSVPVLQQAGGLQASVVLGVGELGGWGALCRCWPGFQALLFLLLLLSRKRLALQLRKAHGQAQRMWEGAREKKQGDFCKVFSQSEILFTIKGQARADYKCLKVCCNAVFLLMNQICSSDQKGYLISVINTAWFLV